MDIEILSQKFCDYSVSIRGYSKDTVRRYRNVVSFYCKFANISEISQVNDDNVRSLFYFGRTERNWSVNTFIVYHKTLLVFFRWCIKQGYMEKNPILDIEVPKLEKRLPTKLNKQVALKLLEIVCLENQHKKLILKKFQKYLLTQKRRSRRMTLSRSI